MTTIRQDIEKARALQRQLKPAKLYETQGLRVKEKPTGSRVFYCATCKGPVVDSERAREIHARSSPRCKATMQT